MGAGLLAFQLSGGRPALHGQPAGSHLHTFCLQSGDLAIMMPSIQWPQKQSFIHIVRGFAMAKVFRPSSRESSILSKIESSKEHARRLAIGAISECLDPLANAIAMKLVEDNLVETTSKNSLEEQIRHCLEKLTRADDFDIDYQIAPLRQLVPHPHVVSLYVTAFVIEQLINHKDTVDIYGSDEDIYLNIHRQVKKFLPG